MHQHYLHNKQITSLSSTCGGGTHLRFAVNLMMAMELVVVVIVVLLGYDELEKNTCYQSFQLEGQYDPDGSII